MRGLRCVDDIYSVALAAVATGAREVLLQLLAPDTEGAGRRGAERGRGATCKRARRRGGGGGCGGEGEGSGEGGGEGTGGTGDGGGVAEEDRVQR